MALASAVPVNASLEVMLLVTPVSCANAAVTIGATVT